MAVGSDAYTSEVGSSLAASRDGSVAGSRDLTASRDFSRRVLAYRPNSAFFLARERTTPALSTSLFPSSTIGRLLGTSYVCRLANVCRLAG